MNSALLGAYVVVPLLSAVIFGIFWGATLRKPWLAIGAATLESYILAGTIAAAVGSQVLPDVGLTGVRSEANPTLSPLGSGALIALAIFVPTNVLLLWWNRRIFDKRRTIG